MSDIIEEEVAVSTMSGEEVVSAIAYSISTSFSSTEISNIYKNKIKQNMKKPCVFIHQIEADHTNQLRGYATHNYMIDIRVHPEDNRTDIQSWARGIATKMLDAVNVISVCEQSVKARKYTWKVVDDVLHIIIAYTFRVKFVGTQLPQMKTIDYTERVK